MRLSPQLFQAMLYNGEQRFRDLAASLLTVGLLLAFCPVEALAATPNAASGETTASSANALTEYVPVADVPARAQATHERLMGLEAQALADPRIEQIKEELPELRSEIKDRAKLDTRQLAEHPTRTLVDTMARSWGAYSAQVTELNHSISKRTSTVAQDVSELTKLRTLWQNTREQANAAGLTGAILKRTKETLKRIDQTRRVVDARMAALVSLQDKVSELEAVVYELQAKAISAEDQLRVELFSLDSPPLWSLSLKRDTPLSETTQNKFKGNLEQATDFIATHAGRLVGCILGGILLITFLSSMSRSAKRSAEKDPAVRSAATILQRPFSAGILVSLGFGALVLTAIAPPFVAATAGLILIVPILRLLPYTILLDLRWALYSVSLWFALAYFHRFFLADPTIIRLALLFESVAVLAVLVWLLRPARLDQLDKPSNALRTIGFGIRASIPILVIAIITNITGNVGLAELLMRAILATVYLAFLFFACESVLEAALTMALRTHVLRKLRMVRNHGELILRRGTLWIHLGFTFLWLSYSAQAFRVRSPIVDGVHAFLTANLEVGDLEISSWDFILFGLMIWLSLWASRSIRFVLEEDVLTRATLPRGVPFAISTMARYTVLLTGFFVAVAAAGFDLSRFALLAGALGVGIGIGLQDVVNNFVSGLILLFERPIQLGDIVEVGERRGEVKRIGMRSSTVHTFDGAEVIIPNSQFISKDFVNWTLSNRQRRINVFIGVAYGTDPTQVIEILTKIAQDNDDIRNYPAPQALFVGFGDSSLDFELRGWTDRFDGWRQVQSDMSVAISVALREAEIQIPFPQRDLHLRTVSPEARETITPVGTESSAIKDPPD